MKHITKNQQTRFGKTLTASTRVFSLAFMLMMIFSTTLTMAQTPVPMSSQPGLSYTENFADVSNWTNGFAAGIGASCWASYPINATGTVPDGKKTTKSSATFTTGSTGGVQKGAGNLVFLSTGSSAATEAVAVDFLMDFTGVNAGTISYNWATIDNSSGTRPTSLRVYWSTDNTTFTEITALQVIDVQTVNSGSFTTVALPSAFNGSATARLRFYNHAGTITGTGSRDKISIDDLTVTAAGNSTPTTMTVTNITPASPVTNTSFSATVTSVDGSNIPQTVVANTDVTLSLLTGTGALTGTVSGTILAGTNNITISGLLYNTAETISLTATRTAGDALTPGNSATFVVQAPPPPVITLTGTLLPFSAVVGTPSAQQFYTVSGANLVDNILITPPAGFEIRTGVNAFANATITLPHTLGIVASTLIDVRFNPASSGPVTDNIAHTSNTATTQNEAVTGSTVDEPTIQPTVTVTASSIHTLNLSFSGGNGTSRIVVVKGPTASIGWTPTDGVGPTGVSSNFTNATSQTLSPDTNKIVYNNTGTTATITGLNPSTTYQITVYEYNGVGVASNYVATSTATTSGTTTAPGTLPIPVPMASQVGLTFTEPFTDIANWTDDFEIGTGSEHWTSGPLNIVAGAIPDGIRITTSTATFATGSTNGGVQRGSLTATGSNNVPGTIVLLSTGNTNNSNSCAIDIHVDFSTVYAGTLSFDWATVINSTGDRPSSLRVYTSPDGIVYTELPAAAVLDKANGAVVTGSITTVALPASLNGMSNARIRFYEHNAGVGSTGSRAKISIDNVTITATLPPPPATQLAITNITPSSPTVGAPFSVTVQSQDLTSSPTNVVANTDVTISLNTGTGVVGGTVTGTILAGTNSIVITGITYSVAEAGVILTATRTAGDILTPGNSSAFTVIPPTSVITVTGTLTPFLTGVGTQSTPQTYSVEGVFLTAPISITPPAEFEVSLNGTSWTVNPNSISLSPTSGTVTTTTVYVRYSPSIAGPHSGNVSNSSAGAVTQDVAVSGSTVATEPTQASTLVVGCAGTNSVSLSFTNGNGSNRIVVARTGSAVSFVPADGTAPSGVNTDFSLATDQIPVLDGNRIVYDGSGTTTIVTGLSSSTQYYFDVYEYNGSGAITDYLTSTFGTGNTMTTGPASYSLTGGTYTQDFNGLPSAGTFTFSGVGPFYLSACPIGATNASGWQFGKVTGSGTNALFSFNDGVSISGSAYSYGVTGSGERSLGGLISGTVTPNLGLVLKNTTSDVLTTVTISYTGEQWRVGGSGQPNSLKFSYSVGASDILSGTYTTVPTLDFVSPNLSTTASALVGNAPGNFTVIPAYTFTLNSNWAPGQTLVLRWDEVKGSGNGDGLAIEDFSFSAIAPSAPIDQDNTIVFSNISTVSVTADWTTGSGANRLVKINTVNSFTPPANFTGYTANAVYGGSGEQVVYNGPGSTVNVSGLTPGVQYFFRVYGYNGTDASAQYNTATEVGNPNNVTTTAISSATKLAILSVNGGSNPTVNQPFSVVVQAQDNLGNPQNVVADELITLSVFGGIGNIAGTISGTMLANTNTVTITGVTYDTPDNGVQLAADGGSLTQGVSATFDVIDIATLLNFGTVPTSAIVNTVVGTITVKAVRGDLTTDPNYIGQVTISINTGPIGGVMSGTLTQTAVAGVATFTGIQFSLAGSYTVLATGTGGLTSTVSSAITITDVPTMTELVVPRFMGSKTSGSANSTRTPIAVCLQIDNLVPNTTYDIRTGMELTSGAATSFGAGNVWNGTAFAATNIQNLFTTNASGSSGPFWIYLQATGNASRFGGGQIHNIRIGYLVHGGTSPTVPHFVSTNTITCLDIQSTATVTTADDGAYLKGTTASCAAGKYVLVYDNTAGTGMPIFSYQARQATPVDATASSYSGLDVALADIYKQSGTSAIGDWPAVIPIGAINPNGVRRIEARNANNTIFGFDTDNDGVWPGGANTTTITRKALATLTLSDAPLSTLLSSFSPTTGCEGVAVVITGSHFTGATDVSFNGVAATFSVFSDNEIHTTVPAGATSGTISVTTPGCTVVSTTTFDVVSCGIEVSTKIFIEGYYTTASAPGLMDNFGSGGCLWVSSVDGGNLTPIPGVQINDVDTVFISAMNATTYAEVDRQWGILQTDGSITVKFSAAVTPGDYYLKVNSRTTVETWGTLITLPLTAPYNFSAGNLTDYWFNMGLVDAGLGIYANYSGDIADDFGTPGVQNGYFEGVDFSASMDADIQSGNQGYVVSDLDGDGFCTNFDFIPLDPHIQSGAQNVLTP